MTKPEEQRVADLAEFNDWTIKQAAEWLRNQLFGEKEPIVEVVVIAEEE